MILLRTRRHLSISVLIRSVRLPMGMMAPGSHILDSLRSLRKIFLIRESILTAALGVVCLLSLLFPRPLMFYFGRQFVSGGDPAKAAFYSSLWQYPRFRFSNSLITLVWGMGLLIEFALRVILVYTLPVAQVLALSPLVFNAITIGLILWTIACGNRARRKRQQQ